MPTGFAVLAVVLVVALVLWRLLPSGVFTFNLGATVGGTGGIGIGDLALRADELIANHFRANYGGDPTRLSDVIASLLVPLRQLFVTAGVPLEGENLRTLILVSTARHQIATPEEVKAAFDTALARAKA